MRRFPDPRAAAPLIVLAGGLLAAAFDIAWAGIYWAVQADVPLQRILQSVAAGVLGEASFTGGVRTAALGLALHVLNATIMAFAYALAARRWPILWQRPLLCGGGYGLLLYAVMNYVVVPLSAAGGGARDPLWITLTIAVHVLLIGMPIAWFVRLAHDVRQRGAPATAAQAATSARAG